MNVIETDCITFTYEGAEKPSLTDVTIKIRKGVKTVILGANGAGKSTLFYQFNGVERPDKGTVSVLEKPLRYKRKNLREVRSKVAVVLQNPDDQVFGQTVESDVAYGPRNIKLPEDEVKRRVDEALFQTGLSEFRDRNTLQLSYGQRKRLALAGALAMKPEVLIMDEPTAGLDPQMALELMELAEQLHNKGTTIVISTHDVDLAYAWADEIHVLRKSEIIYSGTSEGFYGDPALVHSTGVMAPSMFVMNRNLSQMKEIPELPCPRTESQLISKMAPGQRGRMTVLPVRDSLDEEMLRKAGTDVKTGIFGTNCRRLVHENRLAIDYVFDGYESCMAECLMGKDSLLICDEDCLDLILRKIESLKDFGSDIAHTVIG